ncbi:cupredoxin domain-containing protein [Thermaerobacter subterraneus]|uniref:Copper-binding protein n=1 Tax=Thermaerobacter subterraneus DSM 13965 TaxID=867903 RepID=K6QFL1_9FIRM|nr:cupredoxin domain-containing protein [Thermaerobacter subterraneus]EKP95826.1 putative copper-binding protein [Thermaerobacter subterraneus DSM 13965]
MSDGAAPGPAARSVIALLVSAALLAGALGLHLRSTRPGVAGVTAPGRPVADRVIRLSEYAYQPAVIEVRQGTRVRLTLINTGREEHELEIDGYGIEVAGLRPGTSVRLIFNADLPGRFELACHMPGHYEKGMRGILVVHPADAQR